MAYGLRIRNSSGQITLDTSDDTLRIGGLISLPSAIGTINFRPSSGKSVFFIAVTDYSYTWSYSDGVISYNAIPGAICYYGEM